MGKVQIDRAMLNNFRNAFCMTFCSHHANIVHRKCRECLIRNMNMDNYGTFYLSDLLEVKHDNK